MVATQVREVAVRHEIIPSLRYADALRAIEFLCAAFGFERAVVYADEHDPTVVPHAQLTWCDRMIIVSSIQKAFHQGCDDEDGSRGGRSLTAVPGVFAATIPRSKTGQIRQGLRP